MSRALGDDIIWLISDNQSPALGYVEDWLVYDARWWLPRVMAALREMAPASFADPSRLQWGIYEAPKVEGRAPGAIVSEERIEQFRLTNLWAVWPTKLTLAPQVSREVTKHIKHLIPQPHTWTSPPQAWSASRVPADVAPERWRKTPLTSWDEFRRAYNL